MGERLRTVREPIAWIVLLISTGYVVLSLVEAGLLVVRDGESWPSVGGAIGGGSLSATLVVAVVAAGLVCLLVPPSTGRVRQILFAGALLLTFAALLEVVFTVLGALAAAHGVAVAMEVVGGLLGAGFKTALAAVLWRAWTQAPRSAVASAVERRVGDEAPDLHRPTWHPDTAAGASWSRAGDAATGASASTVGRPGGEPTGWQVPTEQPPVPSSDGWLPPSQQARPPSPGASSARTPWTTAFDAAQGTPVVPDEGVPSRDPSEPRPAPLWRPIDPDRPDGS